MALTAISVEPLAIGPPIIKDSHAHIQFLDHIRGAAILAVFFHHALTPSFGVDPIIFKGWFHNYTSTYTTPLFLFPFMFGYLGVAIFFVVSGFCIHLSHERSNDKVFSGFFFKRFFRIYPPYLVALLLFAFIFPLTRLRFDSNFLLGLTQLGSHLIMVHNLDRATLMGINGSFWSVAVEVQLYALYPLLLCLTRRWGWSRTLWITAIIEISLRILEGALGLAHVTSFSMPSLPFLYWYSWTIGAALAEAYLKQHPLPFVTTPLFLWPLVTVLAYFFKPLFHFTFLFGALSTACCIAHLLRQLQLPTGIFEKFGRYRFWIEPLRFIGLISYSFYLIHQPIVNSVPIILATVLPGHHLPGIIVYIVICFIAGPLIVILSYGFYRFIEIPSISLGKRLRKSISR